jgi:hypothetical protein
MIGRETERVRLLENVALAPPTRRGRSRLFADPAERFRPHLTDLPSACRAPPPRATLRPPVMTRRPTVMTHAWADTRPYGGGKKGRFHCLRSIPRNQVLSSATTARGPPLAESRADAIEPSRLGPAPHWPVLTRPRLAGFQVSTAKVSERLGERVGSSSPTTISQRRDGATLVNHLIRPRKHGRWDRQAKRLRELEGHGQPSPGRAPSRPGRRYHPEPVGPVDRKGLGLEDQGVEVHVGFAAPLG